ncbi:hypothetical protein G6F42_022109 [Rhizopus arrhizus]|nr:hypothetical protein G6F42_022109 [Rhizopus arrhizus]
MSNTITPNNPPYPAFRATNKESFAYETTIRRWPIIIDSAIKDVKQTIAETTAERAQEGASIVAALEDIKQELIDEKPLR